MPETEHVETDQLQPADEAMQRRRRRIEVLAEHFGAFRDADDADGSDWAAMLAVLDAHDAAHDPAPDGDLAAMFAAAAASTSKRTTALGSRTERALGVLRTRVEAEQNIARLEQRIAEERARLSDEGRISGDD